MADDSSVQVHFSQEGGDDIISKLKEIIDHLAKAGEESKQTGEALKGIGGAMGITALATGATAVMELGEKAWEAARKIGEMASQFIEAAAHDEQLNLQIASLTESIEGFDKSLEHAKETMLGLKDLKILGDEDQLASTFRRLTLLVGGTSQSITDLTNRMGLFAQQNGVATESLLRVIQMAERTGSLPMRGNMAFASMALQRAGITGQEIQQAGAAITGGDTEAMDRLLQKIHTSKEATDALENSWKNLGDQYNRAKGEIVDIIGTGFEPLKLVVKEIVDLLKSPTFRTWAQEFADAIKHGVQDSITTLQNLSNLIEHLSISWGIAKRYWSTDPGDSFGAVQDASAAETKRWAGVMAQKGYREHGREAELAVSNFENQYDQTARGGPVSTPPVGPDTARQIKAAQDAYDEFVKGLQRKVDVSGLEGIDKALADIDAEAAGSYEQLDKMQERLAKLGKPVSADADFAARALIWEKQHRASAEAVAQAWEKEEKQRVSLEDQTTSTLDQMRKKSTVDAIGLIQQQADAEIDAETRKVHKLTEQIDAQLKAEQQANDAGAREGWWTKEDAYDANVTAYQNAVDKKKALADALAQFEVDRQKKADDQKALLRDQELGLYGDYYNRLMKKSAEAHQNMFEAAQQNANATADLMAKQAQTIEEGVNAAAAKVLAGVKSMGQNVYDLLTSMWGALTKSFEEGFYDILTGKFDSLKDVLKSLWDSILKDFSKMLAQMLERWLLTGDAMGNGQGGGGIGGVLQSLVGGGNAVYTPQGSGVEGRYGPGTTQYGDYTGGNEGSIPSGGSSATAGWIAGGVQVAYGLYQNYQDSKHQYADVGYGGVSMGQQDFGGNANFGRDFTPFATAAVTLAATGVGIVAAVIVAAVGLIVAGLNALFNGPQEGHVDIIVADAFKANGGVESPLTPFVRQVFDSTANFLVGMAKTALKPEQGSGLAAAYMAAVKDFFGTTYFTLSAGSGGDLNADLKDFFQKQFPKMAMQVGFGQFGDKYGWPSGNRDAQGGFAGMDWNPQAQGAGFMDKEGNWIKQQLYDENAPIPAFLKGIGFAQSKIAEIAQKLASSTDMGAFKTYLSDLVGVVVDLGLLAADFGRTRAQWYAEFDKAKNQKGTAAEFTTQIANLMLTGQQVDLLTGDERLAAAKQLVTDSQALEQNMANALASIYTMIDAIQKAAKDTVETYREKLMTPAEREASILGRIGASPSDQLLHPSMSRGGGATGTDLGADWKAVKDAANPADVQTAWNALMKDLTAELDILVARIQAIKALQQSYADFRTQMAKDAGPQFGTDPAAWLAQNAQDIATVTNTLKTATGDDAIKGAQTLLDLTRERYQNEIAQLAKINGMIQSIGEQGQQTSNNLRMQAMGKVVNGQWVPDVHAQGEFLTTQYNDLMGQLANAKTPEEVQKLYNQIQGIISQLASQPQDPSHYAESRTKLIEFNDAATKAAQTLLGKWGKDLDTDIAGTGDKLAAGEEALNKALGKAQSDFEKYTGYITEAAGYATDALNTFADGFITALANIEKAIVHWQWTMTHADTDKDPNWDYEKNAPKGGYTAAPEKDVWQDDPDDPEMQVCVSGPNKGKKRHKPGAGGVTAPGDNQTPATAPGTSASSTAGGPAVGADEIRKAMDALAKSVSSKTITVNVNSGTPEEIAAAAASAVYGQTLRQIRDNNVEVVRVLRNNPGLTQPAWRPTMGTSAS